MPNLNETAKTTPSTVCAKVTHVKICLDLHDLLISLVICLISGALLCSKTFHSFLFKNSRFGFKLGHFPVIMLYNLLTVIAECRLTL